MYELCNNVSEYPGEQFAFGYFSLYFNAFQHFYSCGSEQIEVYYKTFTSTLWQRWASLHTDKFSPDKLCLFFLLLLILEKVCNHILT